MHSNHSDEAVKDYPSDAMLERWSWLDDVCADMLDLGLGKSLRIVTQRVSSSASSQRFCTLMSPIGRPVI